MQHTPHEHPHANGAWQDAEDRWLADHYPLGQPSEAWRAARAAAVHERITTSRTTGAAFTLACIAVLIWPAGIPALLLGLRAARRGAGALAAAAIVLGTFETAWTLILAGLIITRHAGS